MYNNALEHHGIEGQKWGVRRGPPYPLNSSQKSSKKSRKKKSSAASKRQKEKKKAARKKWRDEFVASYKSARVEMLRNQLRFKQGQMLGNIMRSTLVTLSEEDRRQVRQEVSRLSFEYWAIRGKLAAYEKEGYT